MGRRSKDETKLILIIAILIIVFGYEYVVKPIIEWSKEHWIISSILIIIIFGIIIFLAYIWITTRTEESGVRLPSNTLPRQESSVSTGANQISAQNLEINKPTEPTIKRKSKMEKIIEALNGFEPHSNYRDEKELEKELYAYLTGRFRGFEIEPQYKTDKIKVDLLIDKEIAIEIKIADSRANVRSLEGQLSDYLEVFDKNKIIAVILDIGKVPDLDDLVLRFKKKGAKVVVLSGPYLKRPKPAFMKQTFYK